LCGHGDTSHEQLSQGPDLLIMDEAHKIKNPEARLTESLSAIRTPRRVRIPFLSFVHLFQIRAKLTGYNRY
jgi:hypothetical protein